MAKLLDVAAVHRGSGRWTSGLSVEGLQCALTSSVATPCLPPPAGHIGGRGGNGAPTGYPLSVFAVVAQLTQPTMCRTSDPNEALRQAVGAEADKAAGSALWFGTGNAAMWMGAPGSTIVSGGVAELLDAFYAQTVGVDPVIHMGLKSALAQGGLNKDGRFKALPDIPVVVNPSYPIEGIAVTGPVEVWIGDAEITQTHDVRVTREFTEATALAAVALDPCAVVINAAASQTYLGQTGVRKYAVSASGNSAGLAVNWGDSATGTVPPNGTAEHTYTGAGSYTVTVASGPTYTIQVV